MRKLTIKRIKSFVGSLMKITVYVEDLTSNEIVIQNTPCRKIGRLKNGEQKTFLIEESAVKVFVIMDKMSKNYCNDSFIIPEGQQDVFISGQNRFDPFGGNAFVFNNNPNLSEKSNKTRRGNVKLWILMIIMLVVFCIGKFLIIPAFLRTSNQKEFSREGMTITLTDEFKETNFENYTACYDSSEIAVFTKREDYSLFDNSGDYSLSQYAQLIEDNNKIDAEIKSLDGLTYFQYTDYNEKEKNTYVYYTYVFKSNDSYWIIQFATLNDNADKNITKITEWAKSVRFK